jgi:hypothetical protein
MLHVIAVCRVIAIAANDKIKYCADIQTTKKTTIAQSTSLRAKRCNLLIPRNDGVSGRD